MYSVSRCGADTMVAEEVKTPKKKAPTLGRSSQTHSPTKHTELEDFDAELIPFILEGPDMSKKRQTMVFLSPT